MHFRRQRKSSSGKKARSVESQFQVTRNVRIIDDKSDESVLRGSSHFYYGDEAEVLPEDDGSLGGDPKTLILHQQFAMLPKLFGPRAVQPEIRTKRILDRTIYKTKPPGVTYGRKCPSSKMANTRAYVQKVQREHRRRLRRISLDESLLYEEDNDSFIFSPCPREIRGGGGGVKGHASQGGAMILKGTDNPRRTNSVSISSNHTSSSGSGNERHRKARSTSSSRRSIIFLKSRSDSHQEEEDLDEDKDSREGLKTRGSYLEEDVSSEVVLPPQSLRRLKDSSSSSKSPIPILEDSFAPKRIEYSLSMHHRRPARSKEDRRRGSSVSRLLPPPSSSSSSSSDEESSSLQHESYSRYRRRRRKKRKNKRVTATASPEHIYHTIDSEGTRSKSSSYELTESLNQSTSSLKLPHSRGVAAAPLLLGGGPPLSPSMKRKSLLNTSYSSEEILIQAVNSLHGLGDELKASVSSNSSSPQTPMSTLGGSHSAGSKTLSSPDIVKSLSKTLTPPISPHHHRPFLPAPAVERSDLISDPLLEHWPGRPKSSSSNNNFHNNNTNSSNSSSNNNNVKKLSDKTTTSPITSPSATSASKPPIFPLLNGGANGSHPSSSSSIKGLGAISLRKPSESFLSRRTSSPDNSTPQFVKEFRRRSGGFTPNEVLPPASRPQSAVFLRSPEDNEPGGHVKFNSEVLENNAGEPPVPAPRESLLRKKSLKESEPAQVAMRNRSSSLTLHDKRSPDPNHHSSSSSCNSSNSSSSLLPKPILKKSSEDLLKDPCNSFSGILKRKSSEYDHIRIQSPSPDAGDLRPILRGCSLGGEGEEEDSPQSILKRSLDEDDPSSSSIENISPQGILKRRSSSVGVIGDRSLDDLSEEPSLRPSILKKQGSMEELIDVKSILKKTDDELEEEVRGGGGSSCTTPKSILKSRKSEESLSSPLDSCEVYRRTHEEEGIRRPILKRKESREELLLAVSHRLSQRSFRSPDVEHRSILIRPRPSSLGSPREESVEYSSRSEPLVGAISNRLRRADSEQNYSSPSRTYVSLSEARRAAASTAVSTTSTAASSASSSNPKRSSSLRSVNDYEQENNKIEKGALSFGGAVVFGTGSNRESSSGDGKRRRSSDNSGANSSSGSCSLRKEEPYGILKRRVSRRDYEFEGETTSHSLSGGSSTNSTPRKSILKYDGDHVGIIGGGDASINPLNSNPSPSSQSEDKRLKGVLKKDSSYEETLRRPILKNTSTEENISFQEQQHQQSSLLLSSSCSSEDIARTFNDVIIDPIPNERRHEEEEDAEAALPREEDVEEAQPEEEEQQMRVSKLSEPPPSVVNISADGDLASKLQQLAVKAEAIKQQQQQQKETSRMPLTTPLNKCIKKSASFREPRSTSQHASSSRPTIRNRSSSRSLTTEVSADEYYQIFKQQKKRTEGDGDEDFSASSSSLSNSPSSKEHRMREILEKENSVPKRPKPEIKINGGGIADRLAALKKNGEEGWKKKVQKMDVIETTASVPNGGGGGREKTNENSRPSSLTDRLSQLQSSQNTWQCKVASDKKEASKFTVAGKMSRFGVISHNSSGGESGDEERTRCTPRLRSFGSPKLVRPRSCIIEDDSPSSSGLGRRKLSTPVSRSKSSVEHRRRVVILPSGSNDEEDGGLRDFYGKIEEDPKVALPSLPLNTDLDAVMGGSEDFKPLSAVKRAKGPLNKRRPTSGNPIKKLAAREDILHVYTESVKTTTREEAVASKSSKQSHLAAEALAGLASKEDFSSVQLKRGNTSVPNQEFLPYKEDLMLLQVKGRRHCQTRLVEPRASSINSGDCYVLVTLSEVFHWIGRFSNVIERARSAEVALHIQQVHDLGFKGSSRVITVEDPSHNRKFWSYLSGGSEPMEAGPSDEDELYEGRVNEFNLIWEVSPLDGTLNPVQDFWGTVPRYSLLDPEKVLVLDFGSELYLWSGKTAGFELRKAGLQSIKELWDSGYDFEEGSVNPVLGSDLPCKAPARPSWCILGRVNSHMETVLFREKFQDWPQDESSRVIQKNKGEERKIKVVRSQISPEPEERSIFDIQSYDAEEMAQFPLEDPDMELENSHLGRGSGYYDETERRNYEIETLDISVWYMQEFNENRLCLEEWKAQFHVEDAYIVRWKYKVSLTGRDLKGNPSKHSAVGRERIAFFFWQGSESGVNEKGASALKTVELDRERGPQIRVDQGREEAAFLHLWAGQMMVHFGKRNKRRRSSEHHRLYVLRGVTPQEVHLVEVECQSSSLRSLGTFILFSPEDSQIHIWHGRDSPPIGRELARGFVNRFKADPPLHELDYAPGREISISEEMHDGHSTSGPVFEALGANIAPLNLLYPPSMSPRLYRMTSVSGRFLVNEFLCLHRKVDTRYSMPFHQADLYNAEQPALFLLDLGPKLWLWQGWWPERDSYKDGSVRWHAERRAAMQTASDHWALRHGGGEPRAQLVWAGHEPEEFKHLFPSWKTINDVQDLNQPFVGSSDLMSVLSSLSRMEYSWNDLCKRPLPDGVDPSKLEKYLNEQEFKEYLGLSREDFSSSPKWKQIEIRKEKGLF